MTTIVGAAVGDTADMEFVRGYKRIKYFENIGGGFTAIKRTRHVSEVFGLLSKGTR